MTRRRSDVTTSRFRSRIATPPPDSPIAAPRPAETFPTMTGNDPPEASRSDERPAGGPVADQARSQRSRPRSKTYASSRSPPITACPPSFAPIASSARATARSSPKACSPTCAACDRLKRSPRRAIRAISRWPSRCARWAGHCATSRRCCPASDDIWLRAFKSRLHNPLPPAVAHDVPDWLWDAPRRRVRRCDALGARARVARTRADRPARQHDEDRHATRRSQGLAGRRTSKRRRRPTRRSAFACSAGRRSTHWIRDGRVEVQDEGSQLVGFAVAPQAQRDGRGLLRRRGRQDAAARRAHALAGPPVRVRRQRSAARQARAAPCALGTVERASASARRPSATRRSSASRARSTACSSTRRARASARCAAIPTSSGGSTESAVAELVARQHRDPDGGVDAREARRPARLCNLQRAARGERARRGALPRRRIRRSRMADVPPTSPAPASRSTTRPDAEAAAARAPLRRILRGGAGARS